MNKYDTINQIGDGTFGSVAKAVNKMTGELVAIKKMKQKYYSWEECVKLPEVDVVRRIHGHPNIVKLREVIREHNDLYFVFEYMDGDVLGVIKKAKQLLRPELAATAPAIPYPRIKSYMRQLLQSLAYLHKKGYFHRDLKPENLLVKRDGEDDILKLADFGLVKEIRARPPFTDYVSTRWYRAPELLLQDRAYSAPVDIWAAGCIMSELITTKPLFPGSNEVDQLFKTMNVLSSPTDKTWPGGMVLAKKIRYAFPTVKGCGLAKVHPTHVPAEAIDLMAQMLTYDPKRRPTAEQCLQHPFFNVGVDESTGPSSAAVDQLASAAKRLQPSSAPPNLQSIATEKENRNRRTSLPEAGGTIHAKTPQKFFMLGLTKPGMGSGAKDTGVLSPRRKAGGEKGPIGGVDRSEHGKPSPHEPSLDPAAAPSPPFLGLEGLHLANAQLSPGKLSLFGEPTRTTPSGPSTSGATPKTGGTHKDLDLDNLMEEFATEISSLGVNAQKAGGNSKASAPPPASHSQARSPRSSVNDPVAVLLNNSRYKRSSLVPDYTSAISPSSKLAQLRNAKLNGPTSSTTAAMAPPQTTAPKSVSPSIQALLAKHRARGAFNFQ